MVRIVPGCDVDVQSARRLGRYHRMSDTAAEIPSGRSTLAPAEIELAELIVTALNLDVG